MTIFFLLYVVSVPAVGWGKPFEKAISKMQISVL